MIARHWRALARTERAADYLRHLRGETFPALKRLPGFVDAAVHSRRLGHGVEFQVITRWRSLEAIAAFAGEDIETAVVPGAVQDMMLEYDDRACHFEVHEEISGTPRTSPV